MIFEKGEKKSKKADSDSITSKTTMARAFPSTPLELFCDYRILQCWLAQSHIGGWSYSK